MFLIWALYFWMSISFSSCMLLYVACTLEDSFSSSLIWLSRALMSSWSDWILVMRDLLLLYSASLSFLNYFLWSSIYRFSLSVSCFSSCNWLRISAFSCSFIVMIFFLSISDSFLIFSICSFRPTIYLSRCAFWFCKFRIVSGTTLLICSWLKSGWNGANDVEIVFWNLRIRSIWLDILCTLICRFYFSSSHSLTTDLIWSHIRLISLWTYSFKEFSIRSCCSLN